MKAARLISLLTLTVLGAAALRSASATCVVQPSRHQVCSGDSGIIGYTYDTVMVCGTVRVVYDSLTGTRDTIVTCVPQVRATPIYGQTDSCYWVTVYDTVCSVPETVIVDPGDYSPPDSAGRYTTPVIPAQDSSVRVRLTATAPAAGSVTVTAASTAGAQAPGDCLGAYDIALDPALQQVLVSADLSISVTADSGVNTSLLALYHLNPSSGSWQKVTGSGYDSASGAVVARVTHFSTYGVFAQQATATRSVAATVSKATAALRVSKGMVSFTMAEPGMVTIRLHRPDGRLVAVLANGVLPQGSHTVALANVAPGMYVLNAELGRASVRQAVRISR